MSPDLTQLRKQMDAVDDELMGLVLQRIELSSRIMQTKPAGTVVDPSREQAIVARYFEKLSGVSTLAKTQRLVASLIGASSLYPEP